MKVLEVKPVTAGGNILLTAYGNLPYEKSVNAVLPGIDTTHAYDIVIKTEKGIIVNKSSPGRTAAMRS